jgi:hypothetical protein
MTGGLGISPTEKTQELLQQAKELCTENSNIQVGGDPHPTHYSVWARDLTAAPPFQGPSTRILTPFLCVPTPPLLSR